MQNYSNSGMSSGNGPDRNGIQLTARSPLRHKNRK
jgi:hypothetical protein